MTKHLGKWVHWKKLAVTKQFRRFNLVNFYFVANFAKSKRRRNLSASGMLELFILGFSL